MFENQISIPITKSEKCLVAVNALFWGIGTSSIISEGLWYASELGLNLAGITAIAIFAGISFATLIITIPIAYTFYKEMLSEAQTVNNQIQHSIAKQIKYQHKVFFEMLRLRSLSSSNEQFIRQANHTIHNSVFHRTKLLSLVNETYEKLNSKTYKIIENENRQYEVRESKLEPDSISFLSLLKFSTKPSNFFIRHFVIDSIQEQNDFNTVLSRCFKKNHIPKVTDRASAISQGVITGLTISGVTLGTGWSFAALGVGMGLCAAVPIAGWIILAATSLAMGIAIGIGMGFNKQKNNQRAVLLSNIKMKNKLLISAIHSIQQTVTRKSIISSTINTDPFRILRMKNEEVRKMTCASKESKLVKQLKNQSDNLSTAGTSALTLIQTPTSTRESDTYNSRSVLRQ